MVSSSVSDNTFEAQGSHLEILVKFKCLDLDLNDQKDVVKGSKCGFLSSQVSRGLFSCGLDEYLGTTKNYILYILCFTVLHNCVHAII